MASGYLTQAQVKIGDNPTTVGTSSALELESTNKALVITRVANTAAITNPVNGMIIYDISSNCIKSYEDGAWTNCLSNGSNIEPSTNGTAVVSSYTCSTGSAGTLSAGVQVSGVTQTITANVTQLGTYSLNTFANGVVFSGSGTFTSLGSQTIVLSAIGTPVAVGSNNFTLNTIPNCSFSRTTQGNPSSGGTAIVSAFTCNTASAGTLTVGTAASGVTQTITATVTTAGTYSITATTNGVTFTGSGTFAGTGSQNVVLTATGTPTTPGSNSFTLSTTPNCNFARTVISATSGGTAVVSAYNCSGTSVGTMTAGTAVSGVTQTITATVTTVGTYSISTTAVNGVTFSGSGTFAGTGAQTIMLTASGTPTAAGTNTFPLNITPTCSFTRSTGEAFVSTLCTTIFGSYPATQSIGGTDVTITKTTSTDGGTGTVTNQCGVSLTGNNIALTNAQSATYTFSVPLKNVQVYGSNNESSENNEGFTVTASLAGTAVAVQLVKMGGNCQNSFTTSQSGNTATINNTVTATSQGIVFNISAAGAYDTITISRTGSVSGGNSHSLMLCNATAVPNDTSGGSAVVSAYNCSGTTAGTLAVGLAASGVTQTITATVTTAGAYNISIPAVNGISWTGSGTFAGTGSQTITLTASGTPVAAGTNTFALGTTPTCSFTRTVVASVTNNCSASNPTPVVEVTSPTGRIWMDRNLGATRVATSSTDTQAYGSLFQWGRSADGHQCFNRYAGDGVTNSTTSSTLATSDQPGSALFITASTSPTDWRSDNNNNRWNATSMANNPCPTGFRVPYASEFENEITNGGWSSSNAAGAFGSTLKLTMGGLRLATTAAGQNVGTQGSYWSSTISTTSSNELLFTSSSASSSSVASRASGRSVRCIKETTAPTIGSINCATPTNNGELVQNAAPSGVTTVISYTGGNGISYNAQTVSSTGVTGLTATLNSGTLATGSGTLTYTITGTPTTAGTATFAFTFGGQSCSFTRTVYSSAANNCNTANPTAIVDVVSSTGKTWMDRNLGATRAATSATDTQSYGSLFQWGRPADGHQCVNRYAGDGVTTSSITNTLATSDQPGHASYINITGGAPYDWRSGNNNNRWAATTIVNNPCPTGYTVPTSAELDAERAIWASNNMAGAYSSVLKISAAGNRASSIDNVGSTTGMWSRTINGTASNGLGVSATGAGIGNYDRYIGLQVRCIKL